MTKKPLDTFTVSCPCCQAKLTVDREIGVVLSHVLRRSRRHPWTWTTRRRLLREQVDAVEAKFRASVEAEKSKEDVLARKFAEGFEEGEGRPDRKTSARFRPRLDARCDCARIVHERRMHRPIHLFAVARRRFGIGATDFSDRPSTPFPAGSAKNKTAAAATPRRGRHLETRSCNR